MAKNKLKRTLDKELKIYSAVAAGVLALASPVEAAIHYSGLKCLSVNPFVSQYINLNGDATIDFRFAYSNWFSSPNSWGKGPYFRGQNGAGHIWADGWAYCTDAIRLASNYQIKPAPANLNYHWKANYWDSLNGTFTGRTNNCQGNFNNTTGFLGVRFHSTACQGTNYNYGWIRYRGDTIVSGTIIDWAYQDTCNTPITTVAMPYYGLFISTDVTCNGHTNCFTNFKEGIASATAPTEGKITQETYTEDINLDFNQFIILKGGWDMNFESNSDSYTTIQGSITITDGSMIIENIILENQP